MSKKKGESAAAKKFRRIFHHQEVPEAIIGQMPEVKTDLENEKQEGRRPASRNEPSQRKTETKKPAKKK